MRQLEPGLYLSRCVRFVAAALITFLAVSVANADIVFTENHTGGTNGTISWAGGASNPLIGKDLQINGLYCDTCPLNANDANHALPVIGLLNFTSGLPVPPTASGNFAWGGNGPGHPGTSFEIDGTIPGLIDTSSPLLTGTFQLAIVNPDATTPGGNDVSVTLDVGPDSKNTDILTYYGLPSNTQFAFNAVFFAPSFTPGSHGSFSVEPFNGFVDNAVIPEPSFTWLIGGIAVIGIVLRRKAQAA